MLALEVSGLHKTYRRAFRRTGQQALRGVDLKVPCGAAFGLIGPNGAGKTTFIKTLLGVVRPTEGTVKILGGAPDDPKVRARVGYLPERLHLPGSWTPRAFLASVARLKGAATPPREIDALLERVGLGEAMGRRLGGFSKGMKQRAGLAAALLGRPELLVLDEPTDGIDPLGRVEIRALLAEEVSRGATLFLNSHLLAETERVCDRVAILGAGRLLREGTLEELRRAGLRFRVRFTGAEPAVLATLGFAHLGSDLFATEAADLGELNGRIDRARAAGALLLELGREAHDLEQVLAQAMTEAA